jgi:glutamate/tyrosine decarboxylase-like PLP-dependent enzyme
MAMAGPRFFGFVIGGSLPVTVAANWLATAWDQNTGYAAPTPGASRLEEIARRWLLELLDLPRECALGFVTGATVANFTALAAARNAVLKRCGWAVEADGLFGAPPIQVVVGDECHPTLLKSLGMLGLGRSRLTRVPVDSQGRMRADKLPKLTAPSILCVQAGNVNSGAFDPFEALCAAARDAGAWVHVDGAFGLWAAARASIVEKRVEQRRSGANSASARLRRCGCHFQPALPGLPCFAGRRRTVRARKFRGLDERRRGGAGGDRWKTW